MDKLPTRKNIRIKTFDYSKPGAYFVTICTKDRKNYFWKSNADTSKITWIPVGANCVRPRYLPLSNIGKTVENELECWNNCYKSALIYTYVIMPNHLHIMVGIKANENGQRLPAPKLDRMIKQFKGAVSKKIGASIWQKSYMEHIIRDRSDFETKSKYIYTNPINWIYDEHYSDN